jgi:hypothetical protein
VAQVPGRLAVSGREARDPDVAERDEQLAARTTADLEAELRKRQDELEDAEKWHPDSRTGPIIGRRIQLLSDEIKRRRADADHG